MKKLITGLLVLFLLSMPVACAQETVPVPPSPTPEPWFAQIPALPTEDAIIEMSTVGTMSGMVKHLTISENGSIVYIEEEGPRIVLPGSSRNRTTKTGQLTEAELNGLLEMVDACPFDSEGKCQANTKTTDTDVDSKLYIHYQGTTRIIVSDYQPLYPEVTELPDVPEPVRKLYHELWYAVENRTSQVASEEIIKPLKVPKENSANPVNRGAVWAAVERTLGSYDESNPVKEDLIKRGLVKLEGSGYIRVQEIEELVRGKIYVIDEQGYLQFGTAYVPPKTQ